MLCTKVIDQRQPLLHQTPDPDITLYFHIYTFVTFL